LNFEPSIRARVEKVADCGISGTNDDGDEHEPVSRAADMIIDGIDQPAHLQQ
jgi:hypothetical protein